MWEHRLHAWLKHKTTRITNYKSWRHLKQSFPLGVRKGKLYRLMGIYELFLHSLGNSQQT